MTTVFVIVHGIGTSHRYSVPLYRAIAAYQNVYSVDLPGFGGMSTPRHRLWVEDYSKLLGGLLDTLGVTSCVVIGHSMGAQFATELAVQRPELVSHVVLIGPVADAHRRTALAQAGDLSRDMLKEPFSAKLLVFGDYTRCGPRWYSKTLSAMLAYAAGRQIRALTSRSSPQGFQTGDQCPVVVIPGIYERWQFLQPLICRVHEAGHPVYVVRKLSWNTASVPDAARHVADFIAEEGLEGVVLLAHSKGGLIGKFVMIAHDVDVRILGMIAAAVSFSGSTYARYMLAPSLRSFAASDVHITGLNRNTETNRKIISIFSRFDPHIPEGSALSGGEKY